MSTRRSRRFTWPSHGLTVEAAVGPRRNFGSDWSAMIVASAPWVTFHNAQFPSDVEF
jgi:hypothetical protein